MADNSPPDQPDVFDLLAERFSDAPTRADGIPNASLLTSMAGRGSCRSFLDKPVPDAWINLLSAVALATPTKSDLQQRDIIVLRSPEKRKRLAALVSGQAWVADAPMIIVFCGNNRRQRLVHDRLSIPFANDHLDAFFNAVGDAAIALAGFVTAAEALSLGCCPISAVRNEAQAVSDLLNLPQHVFPFAGLAIGFPADKPRISKRLPMRATYHVDAYTETDLEQNIDQYDQERAATQPYRSQRFPDQFSNSDAYSWSEDKARQYSQPEREDFGDFVRRKGFRFD